VNAVMNIWLHKMPGNFLTSWESVSFWGWSLLSGVSWQIKL
jgi:hypothetical protein